jgi:site-specific DNA-cytosine methylase
MPTFGTVCDGIGCGHLAFNQVGFECAWSFEIEPFPSAVLAYRFPEVTNHGDMLKCAGMVKAGEIEAPDVFIGGTPCQAFSVAGKRKGLKDARGNLSLTFCGIVDAVDDVRRRDGKQPCAVLWENVPGVLSDKGNAFGCFLGELSGAGCQLQPAGGRWRDAGCVFGPKRTVAWRVLDSQFFGVAQRRRRVFVVASAGDGFRPEEVLFEREGVRRDSAPSREAGKGVTSDVGSGSKVGHWDGGDCHPSLTQSHNTGGIGASNQELFSQRGSGLVPDICGCLSDGAHNGGGLNGQDAYTGRIIPVQTYDMRGNGDGETVGTLTGDHAGRPTDYTPVVAIGFNGDQSEKARSMGDREDQAPCLRADGPAHVAVAFERRFVRTSGGQPSIDLQPCLRADANTGDGAPCVAYGFTTKESGKDAAADIIPPLRAESGDPHMGGRMAVAFGGDIARTLSARHDSSPCADRGMDVVATGMQVRRLTPRECERLQGLPDDWTLIPWRGKSAADCPDGPRYKGIGNGQTVNVMRWLAERIKKAIAV